MIKVLEKNNPAMPAATAAPKKSKFMELAFLMAIFLGINYLVLSFFSPSEVKVEAPAEVVQKEVVKVETPKEIVGNEIALAATSNRISNIKLLKYMDGSSPVELLSHPGEFIEFGLIGGGNFSKTITIKENYVISVLVKSENAAAVPYARIARAEGDKDSRLFVASAGGIANIKGDIKRESWSDIKKKGVVFDGDKNSFVGFEDQYWQTVVQIDSAVPGERVIRMKGIMKGIGEDRFQSDISAGAASEFVFNIYAGPKSQKILNAADAAMPGIAQTMDYGWFSFLSRPFLWALTALHDLVGNYGLAIIILTIILRILMIPLTKKSYKSMAAMQKLQPEMKRIQELYKDDKARLQKEMMALYSKTKVNPVSGCLPMLLQIPIFFALYKALVIAVDMRNSDFLWISDLAAADPTNILNLFGLLPFAPPAILPVVGILPILMGASMWLQMRMSSSQSSAMPGMGFMKWIPWVFVVLFASLPAGLILYWTVSNIFGIAQQRFILKTMR